ncbi:MAG: NAD-binding protein [Candidatus Thiodiazotropha sp.]
MSSRETLIFGCGALGHQVGIQLTERGIDAYLYSDDLDEVGKLLAKGLHAGVLDYTDDDKLRDVGIGSWVKTIFCLFSEEAKNLFLTLSVRALDPDLKIICVSESAAASKRLKAAGATKVIDPYEISGHRVHELIARPYLVEMLEHTMYGKQIDVAELEIPADSVLTGVRLDRLELGQRYNLIVLGVVDLEMGNQLIFCNSGFEHNLDPGDILVVIGLKDEIIRLKQDVAENRLEPEPGSDTQSL